MKNEIYEISESVYGRLDESEREIADILLLFIDFFPYEKLEGYSSIASKNLYPKDEEIKDYGSVYDRLSKIPLLEHIENVKSELEKSFGRFLELGEVNTMNFHVGDKRIELKPFDYFILLVSVLYHDVGKSPKILGELGYPFEEYRKSDHAFWSGEYLKKIRIEIEEFYQVKIPDNVFREIYEAIVMHHSLIPKTKYGVILKEFDKRARERELGKVSLGFHEEKLDILTEEDLMKLSLSDEIVNAFLDYISSSSEKRSRSEGKIFFHYFYHPPYIYVNSLLSRKLLIEAIRERKIHVDMDMVKLLRERDNSFKVSQLIVKELFKRDYVKDVRPPFGGRYYLIIHRDGTENLFYGIPVIASKLKNFHKLKPSIQVISVKPLKSQEVKEIKELKKS